MPVLVGTSGWQYRHWRDAFYPAGVPQRLWLEFYAGRFPTVENNGAFYRLPARETFAQWQRRLNAPFTAERQCSSSAASFTSLRHLAISFLMCALN